MRPQMKKLRKQTVFRIEKYQEGPIQQFQKLKDD